MSVIKDKHKDIICSRYQKGESGVSIAKDFPYCEQTIYNILDRNNIDKRSMSKACRKYELDHSSFKILNSEAKYWIGFIMADGSVSTEENMLSIQLQLSDYNHLEKFRKFISGNNKVHKKNNDNRSYCAINLTSEEIIKDLNDYGIEPNKVEYAKVNQLEHDRHFWRGMIDGDGYLSKTDRNILRLRCKSQNIVKQFKEFCLNFINPNTSIYKNTNFSEYKLNDSYAIKLAKKLYKDSEVYLDRKKEIVENWYK